MNLGDTVIQFICNKFSNKIVYISEDVLKTLNIKQKGFISQNVKLSRNIQGSFVLIDNNVGNFFAPVVITDSTTAPANYDYNLIDKQHNVAMYIKRKRFNNRYFDENIYKENENKKLFKIAVNYIKPRKDQPIEQIYGSYKGYRLLIVGGGESWQEIDYARLATDLKVMVINYNFSIRADFLIFCDKAVGQNLNTIIFRDNRIIIGNKNRPTKARDYNYEASTLEGRHTGCYAVQLAERMGFNKVYLVGYDYYQNKKGKDHVYDKNDNYQYTEKRIKRFLGDFDKFKTERTYNLNEKSRLTKLPFAKKEVLYENN